MLSIVETWLATLHLHLQHEAATTDTDESRRRKKSSTQKAPAKRVRPFSFVRLDGSTALSARQRIVDEFNADEDLFAALLTTRVGGVGIDLTGADRVVK